MEQRGQTTVELALGLPFVALLLAAVIEIGMLTADRSRVWHSAREAARAAAVTSDVAEIERAASSAGLDDLVIDVEPDPAFRIQGEPVTVSVAYDPRGHLPIVGMLASGVDFEASVSMRIEQP